ncbi:MAG: M48 family metalloprotease [Ruminococcus sp.]|nr:M48 family metalloprotease [Ruminococcus sp.]
MYASTIVFIIVYILDLFIAYTMSGLTGIFFTMFALPVAVVIQQKPCMLSVGATRLDKLDDIDQDRLRAAFENVLQSAEKQGYSFSRNPKIYLLESDELNAFSCGQCIVINRGLINTICIHGVISHEIKHWKYGDSYCSCLISSSVSILMLMLMVTLGISVISVALVTALIFGIIFGSTAALISGTIVARILNFLKNIIINATYWVINILQMAFSRFNEFKADEWAARIGYADDLLLFLNLTKSDDVRFTSLTQRLLSTHPSNGKRIERLKQIKKQIGYNDTLSLQFDL